MMNTNAHIICNQELRLIGEKVNDFKTWATRRGWAVEVEPAIIHNIAPSAGVCLCAKVPLGLRAPQSHKWLLGKKVQIQAALQGRFLRCMVDVPGWRMPIGVSTAYFYAGEGLSDRNKAILDEHAVIVANSKKQVGMDILAADFNNDPDTIAEYSGSRGLTVIAPMQATYVGQTCSVLVFYLVTPEVRHVVDTARACMEVAPKLHRPAQLIFREAAH